MPMVIMLVSLEYHLLNRMVEHLNGFVFCVVSGILTLILAQLFYRYTDFPFLVHNGSMVFDDNNQHVLFQFKIKKNEIALKDIVEVTWSGGTLYHVTIGNLEIAYRDKGKEKHLIINSDDAETQDNTTTSLYQAYLFLKNYLG